MVGRGHDGVLEAAGVLEVQVELTGARVVLGGDSGTDVGLELVEAVGNDLVVIVKDDLLDEASLAALEPLSGQGHERELDKREDLRSCLGKWR